MIWCIIKYSFSIGLLCNMFCRMHKKMCHFSSIKLVSDSHNVSMVAILIFLFPINVCILIHTTCTYTVHIGTHTMRWNIIKIKLNVPGVYARNNTTHEYHLRTGHIYSVVYNRKDYKFNWEIKYVYSCFPPAEPYVCYREDAEKTTYFLVGRWYCCM